MALSIEDIAQNTGVSLGYLDRQISDEHVLEFAKYCTNFEEIGPYLGLSDDDLVAIDRDKRTTELKRRATLKGFKEANATEATYRKFLKALITCRKANSATEICRVLQEEEASTVGSKKQGKQSDSDDTIAEDPLTVKLGEDDLVKILEELTDVNSIWRELGLALGVKAGKLDEIETDEAKQSRRMMATIRLWLKKDATWQGLIKALKGPLVDESGLAKSIETKIANS